MSQNSSIEWTDATWNPVRGCVKVSPGCANCYAETFAERWRGVKGHAYEQGFDLRLVPEKIDEPLRRKKPTTYFVNSMSDLFQEGVPLQFITDVFGIMGLAHRHTFQVLTKRADRMYAYVSAGDHGIIAQMKAMQNGGGISTRPVFNALDIKRRDGWKWTWPLPNVWLGVSVENQHFADERIPLLLQTPAAIRFISAEPLLGPVDLESYVDPACSGCGIPRFDCDEFRDRQQSRCCPDCRHRSLDWVIVGGESGHGARSFDVAWAHSIVAQCRAAGVPVFVKQFGAKPVDVPYDTSDCVVKNPGPIPLLLTSAKGGDPSEWPEDLRVREFPKSPVGDSR